MLITEDSSGPCIFIDKPLTPRALTLRRKHERLYKRALLSLAARAAHFAATSTTQRAATNPLLAPSTLTEPAAGTPAAAARMADGISAEPNLVPQPHSGGAERIAKTMHEQTEAQAPEALTGRESSPVKGSKADTSTAKSDGASGGSRLQPRQPTTPQRLTRAAARAASAAAASKGEAASRSECAATTTGGSTADSRRADPTPDASFRPPTLPAEPLQPAVPPSTATKPSADTHVTHPDAGTSDHTSVTPAVGTNQGGTGPGPVPAQSPALSATAPRGVTYDLWQLAHFRLVRSLLCTPCTTAGVTVYQSSSELEK